MSISTGSNPLNKGRKNRRIQHYAIIYHRGRAMIQGVNVRKVSSGEWEFKLPDDKRFDFAIQYDGRLNKAERYTVAAFDSSIRDHDKANVAVWGESDLENAVLSTKEWARDQPKVRAINQGPMAKPLAESLARDLREPVKGRSPYNHVRVTKRKDGYYVYAD